MCYGAYLASRPCCPCVPALPSRSTLVTPIPALNPDPHPQPHPLQSEEVLELRSRLRAAQAEVLAAGQRCREATERMARTA